MKKRSEKGEVVVEASIVVTIVIIIITIMLYTCIILYQQTVLSVMSNQTASSIAQVYSNNLKDPFTGYIDPDNVYQSITYSNMKTDAYMNVVEQKANIFAKYRLKSSRLLVAGNTSVEIDVVKKPNELLKSQIVVTVHDKYDIPIVSMFGANRLIEFSASGRADCVDILEYINGVQAIGDPEDSNVSFLPNSKNCVITFIPDRNNPSNSYSVTVLKGKSILSSNRYTHSVMPSDPTNGTFEFDGWVDSSNRSFTATTEVSENLIVYGAWKCNVTLNADGGKVNSNNTYTFKVRVGTRCTFPTASRRNYNFGGWYTQKNGRGTRYNSNDTLITGDVTLYAKWNCAHLSRYESSRTGTVCTGGTIYYKCRVCGINMGSAGYRGSGHNYVARCNVRHRYRYFDGREAGGCWTYHTPGYYYHIACEYCGDLYNSLWCANSHLYQRATSRPIAYRH